MKREGEKDQLIQHINDGKLNNGVQEGKREKN